MTRHKRIQLMIVLVIAALIALSGTYAWYSFNQRRINEFELSTKPGVNLHDDFDGGPDKDVYVENSGAVGLYVRVRLTEYMETVNRGSLIAGHTRGLAEGENETDIARMQWSPHGGIGGVANCAIQDAIHSAWNANDNFHDYYVWTMGGQKFYKPAVQILGEEAALGDNPEVCVDTTVYTDATGFIKQTLPAFVITMEQWINGGQIKPNGTAMQPKESGAFWVVDTDGWCYWAQMLNPNEATGLLIDKVERTSKQFDSDVEYCINVWLQAVDENDIDNGLLSAEENGGMTEGGGLLLHVLHKGALIAADGSVYEDNDDGTFVTIIEKDGSTVENPKAFVPVGNFAGATIEEKAAAAEENRLYVGDTVNIDALIWDGEAYTNYDTLAGYGAPFYNITVTENGEYTVIGTEIGADGNVYLRLQDAGGDALYIASVLAVSTFAPDSPVQYKQGYPGTGPFGRIWAGSAGIGAETDERNDPENPIKKRYFYHIGNGVYIEVADKDGTVAIDEPNTTYYFSSKILGDTLVIDNVDGHPTDLKVDVTFSFSLHIGEAFGVLDDAETGLSIILKDADMEAALQLTGANGGIDTRFEMLQLYRNANDGNLYIDLNQQGYVDSGLYLGGTGEGGTFGGQYSGGLAYEKGGVMEFTGVKQAPGDGSQANPFKIRSRYQMDWITGEVLGGNTFAGQYLEVDKDFSMGDSDFLPIGNATTQFKGIFDGANHTISDLRVNSTSLYSGLFGYLGEGGTVKDLALANVNINAAGYTGGIAGASYNSMISGCSVSGVVNGANGDSVAGIVGRNNGGTGGTIINCTNAATVSGRVNVGGIAGIGGSLTGCTNTGAVTGTNTFIGGVAGNNNATIENCHNTGTVNASGSAATTTGGIVGVSGSNGIGGTVIGCTNSGKVFGATDIGGIAGKVFNNLSKVENSTNTGAVTGTGNDVGGIVGNNLGSVINCENSGVVTGVLYVGGIAGLQNAENSSIAGCSNSGTVTTPGDLNNDGYVGGILGYNNTDSGLVESSFNTGAISGGQRVGGVVGSNKGTVQDCAHTVGEIKGNGSHVGGVAGVNESGLIMSSYAQGAVTGIGSHVGGVVGNNSGTVSNTYAWANVTGHSNNTGGVVGSNNGAVRYSYHAKGAVNGIVSVGGVIGTQPSTTASTENCVAYSTGVSGTSTDTRINRLIGATAAGTIITNSYYNQDMTLVGAGTGNGTGVWEVIPMVEGWWSGTVGFDFNSVWKWNSANNLPTLKEVTP